MEVHVAGLSGDAGIKLPLPVTARVRELWDALGSTEGVYGGSAPRPGTGARLVVGGRVLRDDAELLALSAAHDGSEGGEAIVVAVTLVWVQLQDLALRTLGAATVGGVDWLPDALPGTCAVCGMPTMDEQLIYCSVYCMEAEENPIDILTRSALTTGTLTQELDLDLDRGRGRGLMPLLRHDDAFPRSREAGSCEPPGVPPELRTVDALQQHLSVVAPEWPSAREQVCFGRRGEAVVRLPAGGAHVTGAGFTCTRGLGGSDGCAIAVSEDGVSWMDAATAKGWRLRPEGDEIVTKFEPIPVHLADKRTNFVRWRWGKDFGCPSLYFLHVQGYL